MVIEPARKRPGRHQAQAPSLEAVDGALAETVERQVYRSIRRALMSGLVPPGATLTSRSLALELKVSAQPVRDALKRLEADGVLDGRPQSGFFLRSLTQDEYMEIIEIRQRLEGMAGRLAAASISPETIADLRHINVRMGFQTNSKDMLAENYRFHFAIYTEASRPTLLSLIENLWVRIGPALHHHPHNLSHMDTLDKHETIIAALERGDGETAEKAIAEDLGAAAKLIVPNLPGTV